MKTLIIILLIGTISMISCGSTYRATQLTRPALEETEYVIYKNIDFKYSVGLVDVSKEFVNGLLRARVRVKNLTGKVINAEVKFKFLDKDNFEVGESFWIPMPLESGEIKSMEQITSSKNAVDFRIILQRAGSHRGQGN